MIPVGRIKLLNHRCAQERGDPGEGIVRILAGLGIPAHLFSDPVSTPFCAFTVTFADPNLATPYTQQADLSVEHQFGTSTLLTVSYIEVVPETDPTAEESPT